jgi:hypothetical protein
VPESATAISTFPSTLHVTVLPFARRADGDEVIIANQSRTSFLSLPPDAVELLESLAAGLSVGETRAAYEQTYGVTPDVEDLLTVLESEGFIVANRDIQSIDALAEPASGSGAPRVRYHFENIPETFARRLFGPAPVILAGLAIATGAAAFALDPSVLPGPTVLVFQHDQLALLLAWIALSLVGVFIHELAHLVGARAAGVPSRLGLGNRLWILVAETDMTGIWLASRRQRCLAFLAGPLVDLASAAILLLVVFAEHRHWVAVDPTLLVLIQATLFQYLARLLWQFEFFVPTDFYYVLGALSGCKNLMHDTQSFLLNQLSRVWTQIQTRDLSAIPPGELRVVRLFSIVWLLGRGVAVATLCWITLPILIGYWVVVARSVGGDPTAAQQVVESLFPLVVVVLQTAGLLIWMRGLVRATTPKEGTMP